jgi:uncharacterized membrane protein
MSTESELISVLTTGQDSDGADVQHAGVSLVNRETLYLPASELRGYESVVTGAGDRLLSLFEKQVNSRIDTENRQIEVERELVLKVTDLEFKHRRSVVWLSTFALFMFFVLALIFALCGMELAAIAAVIVPILQGVTSWLYSIQPRAKEKQKDISVDSVLDNRN